MSLGDRTSNGRAFLVIAAVAAVIIGLIGVRGDFPLSDDWAYAYATRSLCESCRIEMLPWTGASLVLQAAYGAILCKLFGFSFTVLRISTLVAGILGVTGFFALARESGLREQALALAVAVFGLCPLYLNLSFTYMTEVPFLAALVWSAFWYAKGLRRLHASDLFVGSVLCSASLLIRQQGVILAFAAALQLVLLRQLPLRKRFMLAAAASALPAMTLAAYGAWVFMGQGMTPAITNRIEEAGSLGMTTIADVGFRSIETLGLLLFPLALPLATRELRERRWDFSLAFLGLVGCAAYLYFAQRSLMFYLGNILYDVGVGSLTLRDTLFLGLDAPWEIGTPLRVVLTVIATAGAAILVAAVIRLARPRRSPAETFVLLAFVLMLGAGIVLQGQLYLDRHLLPALPFAVLVVALAMRGNTAFAWTCVGLLACWSVAGTHDYMAWNRARFDMLSALESAGTDPRSIDGGVEYNGWKLAHELGTWPTFAEARQGQPATKRSWWWVVDDRYVVTFRSLEGYALKAQRQYQRWLLPGQGRVLLLERAGPPQP